MDEFRFTHEAIEQLHEIFEYSAIRFGKIVAANYFESFGKCFRMIAENPEIGRISNNTSGGIRRHEHKSHVIYYKIVAGKVLIGAVIHKTRISKVDFK